MTHTHRPKKYKNYTIFIVIFSTIFLLTFAGLYYFGLVPNEIISGTPKNSPINELKIRVLGGLDNPQILDKYNTGVSENPVYIEIPKVGVSILVQNPESTNVAVLDAFLTKGTVRYPGSGLIGDGNMFIFGHNAEAYKNVTNNALKAFNGIEDLKTGDEIYVKSEKETYVYKVTSYKLANAEEAFVDFSIKQNMLTLSTCNTFGAKQERHVVEAVFVGKR